MMNLMNDLYVKACLLVNVSNFVSMKTTHKTYFNIYDSKSVHTSKIQHIAVIPLSITHLDVGL